MNNQQLDIANKDLKETLRKALKQISDITMPIRRELKGELTDLPYIDKAGLMDLEKAINKFLTKNKNY